LFLLFADSDFDTSGKFTAGVVYTGGNLQPASLAPTANLLQASLTSMVQLDLRIIDKIWNGPSVIFRGLREDDSWKSNKSHDTILFCFCTFNMFYVQLFEVGRFSEAFRFDRKLLKDLWLPYCADWKEFSCEGVLLQLKIAVTNLYKCYIERIIEFSSLQWQCSWLVWCKKQ
jgi:hypothetical protein